MAKTRRVIGTLVLCSALAACSDEPGWRDTSGQGRSSKLAESDQDACFRSEAKSLPKEPTDADQQRVVDRVQACMKRRGWEFSG
jgi:hypothetical protein